MTSKTSLSETTTRIANHDLAGGLNLSTNTTGRADPEAFSVAGEHNLLASIETRLTDEVICLANTLTTFSSNVQLISKELPDTAQFSKAVAALFSLCGLQLGNALLKSCDTPVLFDDGAEYLRQLGLGMKDLFREISLDDRRFLAVALIDKPADQVQRQRETGHGGVDC